MMTRQPCFRVTSMFSSTFLLAKFAQPLAELYHSVAIDVAIEKVSLLVH